MEHKPTHLPSERLRSFGAFVLGGVLRGKGAIRGGDRDDAPLGHPVVGQVDDVPLAVVLVFDDQGDRHAVIVTGSTRFYAVLQGSPRFSSPGFSEVRSESPGKPQNFGAPEPCRTEPCRTIVQNRTRRTLQNPVESRYCAVIRADLTAPDGPITAAERPLTCQRIAPASPTRTEMLSRPRSVSCSPACIVR